MLETIASPMPQTCLQSVNDVEMIVANETQLAALDLYRLGLNVFPLVRGTKDAHFGKWARLKSTRLLTPDTGKDENERAEHLEFFLRLFDDVNIAVMCGRTSNNLTVLDCEGVEIGNYHAEEFAKRGLRPWKVRTARGYHFWWSSDCQVANNPDDKNTPRGFEIRGHSLYVLCPPSVHPSGAIYEWVEREGETLPFIPISKLDWLPITPQTTRRERVPFDDAPLARLFKKTQDFCEGGAIEGARDDRLFAAACDFASKGFALADALPHLMHGCEISGFDKSFTQRQAERTVASAFKKSRQSIKPVTLTPIWARAAAWAASHDWQSLPYTITDKTGRATTKLVSAQSLRAVFLACCVRQMHDGYTGSGVFRAAQREIAEIADLNQRTARQALRALTFVGYLLPCSSNDNDARLFAFSPNAQKCPSSSEWFNSIGAFLRVGVEADIFTHGGLGKTSGRVHKIILERPYTIKEIGERLRLSASTVRKSIAKLRKKGLARKVGKHKWIGDKCDDARLTEIANECGTLGKSQAREAKNAEERARFATMEFLHNKARRE